MSRVLEAMSLSATVWMSVSAASAQARFATDTESKENVNRGVITDAVLTGYNTVIIIEKDGATSLTATGSQSFAFASTSGSPGSCNSSVTSPGDGDGEVNTNLSGASSYASGGPDTMGGSDWFVSAGAIAETGADMGGYFIDLYGEVNWGGENCLPISGGVAMTGGSMFFDSNGTWTADFLGGGGFDPDSDLDTVTTFAIIVTVETNAGTAVDVMSARVAIEGEALDGLTADGFGGYSASSCYGGSGDAAVDMIELAYGAVALDVDEDGRFSQFDADALDDIVGTMDATNSDYTDRFDLSGNGEIDDPDVEIMQALLDAGLGTGVFADVDGDADADCDDYNDAVSDFVEDSVLGDGDYLVEFDYDLDGDNDETDWCEIRALLSPADFQTPYGTLNYDDVLAFLALFGNEDPKADFAAPYGTFSYDDVTAFNTAFANGCP